jgi:hypothetical protein
LIVSSASAGTAISENASAMPATSNLILSSLVGEFQSRHFSWV